MVFAGDAATANLRPEGAHRVAAWPARETGLDARANRSQQERWKMGMVGRFAIGVTR